MWATKCFRKQRWVKIALENTLNVPDQKVVYVLVTIEEVKVSSSYEFLKSTTLLLSTFACLKTCAMYSILTAHTVFIIR